MDFEYLAEELTGVLEDVYPVESRKPVDVVAYFREGLCHSPDNREDPVPKVPPFGDASHKVKEIVSDDLFETQCVKLELNGKGDAARSLRAHAAEVIALCESTCNSIEAEKEEAIRKANQRCCEFVGSERAALFERLIMPEDLLRGNDYNEEIGGDEA